MTNTSGYMVYGIFKCYNFHFNNYVGFSILIKGDNRTTFVVGEHICLLCIAPTVSIAWEIPPFSGISDFVVSSGFPEEQQNGFNASINIKDGKSTLIFVVSKKMNQSLVVRFRDGSVDDFPIISSITLIINSEFLLVNIK